MNQETQKPLKKLLIADSGRASLVMTSEVFKDHFYGVQLLIARSAEKTLEILKEEREVGAVIVDFHLPDENGVDLALKIKKAYHLPVLITGLPSQEIQEIIEEKCYAFDDCLSWIQKPVRGENLVPAVERFFIQGYRTQRRLQVSCPLLLELPFLESKKQKKVHKMRLFMILKDISFGGGKCSLHSQFFFKDFSHVKLFEKLRHFPSDQIVQFLFPPQTCIECADDGEKLGIWMGSLIDLMAMNSKTKRSQMTQKEMTFEKISTELEKHHDSEHPRLQGYFRWESFQEREKTGLVWSGGFEWHEDSLDEASSLFHSFYLARQRLPSFQELQKISSRFSSAQSGISIA